MRSEKDAVFSVARARNSDVVVIALALLVAAAIRRKPANGPVITPGQP
jgi:hypothetical protein